MRNFDDNKVDLEFQLGGEKFAVRRVRPEVLAEFETEGEAPDGRTALALLDDRIKAFLTSDDDRARYDLLRAREDDPVTIGQLNNLLEWALEVASDLPTSPPSPSGAGRGATGGSSKAK